MSTITFVGGLGQSRESYEEEQATNVDHTEVIDNIVDILLEHEPEFGRILADTILDLGFDETEQFTELWRETARFLISSCLFVTHGELPGVLERHSTTSKFGTGALVPFSPMSMVNSLALPGLVALSAFQPVVAQSSALIPHTTTCLPDDTECFMSGLIVYQQRKEELMNNEIELQIDVRRSRDDLQQEVARIPETSEANIIPYLLRNSPLDPRNKWPWIRDDSVNSFWVVKTFKTIKSGLTSLFSSQASPAFRNKMYTDVVLWDIYKTYTNMVSDNVISSDEYENKLVLLLRRFEVREFIELDNALRAVHNIIDAVDEKKIAYVPHSLLHVLNTASKTLQVSLSSPMVIADCQRYIAQRYRKNYIRLGNMGSNAFSNVTEAKHHSKLTNLQSHVVNFIQSQIFAFVENPYKAGDWIPMDKVFGSSDAYEKFRDMQPAERANILFFAVREDVLRHGTKHLRIRSDGDLNALSAETKELRLSTFSMSDLKLMREKTCYVVNMIDETMITEPPDKIAYAKLREKCTGNDPSESTQITTTSRVHEVYHDWIKLGNDMIDDGSNPTVVERLLKSAEKNDNGTNELLKSLSNEILQEMRENSTAISLVNTEVSLNAQFAKELVSKSSAVSAKSPSIHVELMDIDASTGAVKKSNREQIELSIGNGVATFGCVYGEYCQRHLSWNFWENVRESQFGVGVFALAGMFDSIASIDMSMSFVSHIVKGLRLGSHFLERTGEPSPRIFRWLMPEKLQLMEDMSEIMYPHYNENMWKFHSEWIAYALTRLMLPLLLRKFWKSGVVINYTRQGILENELRSAIREVEDAHHDDTLREPVASDDSSSSIKDTATHVSEESRSMIHMDAKNVEHTERSNRSPQPNEHNENTFTSASPALQPRWISVLETQFANEDSFNEFRKGKKGFRLTTFNADALSSDTIIEWENARCWPCAYKEGYAHHLYMITPNGEKKKTEEFVYMRFRHIDKIFESVYVELKSRKESMSLRSIEVLSI